MAFNLGGAMQGASSGASLGSVAGPWGAAAGAVLGGVLGGSQGDGGSRDARQAQEAVANESLRLQREFATHGIRWRVSDAKAAGIHPALALGAPMSPPGGATLMFSDSPSAGELSMDFGQNIGRAIDSTRTQEERIGSRMEALALDRAELQNELLRSQIAQINQQSSPPSPDPANPGVRLFGTTDGSLIKEEPMTRMAGDPGKPHQEAASVTDFGFSRTPTGYAVVPSKDWKDRGEDQLVPEVTWAIRNHLMPTISPSRYGYPPPETWLPEGATRWKFDRVKQEWQPVYTAAGQARIRYPID